MQRAPFPTLRRTFRILQQRAFRSWRPIVLQAFSMRLRIFGLTIAPPLILGAIQNGLLGEKTGFFPIQIRETGLATKQPFRSGVLSEILLGNIASIGFS